VQLCPLRHLRHLLRAWALAFCRAGSCNLYRLKFECLRGVNLGLGDEGRRPPAGALAYEPCQDRSIRGNFSKVISLGSLQTETMPGYTNKSRRYLHLAAANERRAASAYDEKLKTVFLRIAAEYRDLAEQIDDPLQVARQALRDSQS
jgi:hypothetical protein